MLIRSVLLSTISVSIFSSFSAFAAEKTESPTVVVTANRIAQAKEKVGSSVTVITREDIERSGKSQVYDLLKTVPGISVSRNGGGAGVPSVIRIRGSNPGQVRTMIDGTTMGDPSSIEGNYEFMSLLTEDIERIEILRGPQSALYGSDAMGGVINIITRKGNGAPKINALAEVGSHESFRQALGFSGSTKEVDYSLQLQNATSDGISRIAAGSEDDGYNNRQLSTKLGWQATDQLRFDTSGSLSALHSDYDPDATTDGFGKLNRRVGNGRVAATLDTFGGVWQHILSAQASRTKNVNDTPLFAEPRYLNYVGTKRTLDYQSNVKLRKNDVFTAGLVTEGDDIINSETTTVGATSKSLSRNIRNNSFYGQYLLTLTDDTTLTLGGRNDNHSIFGSTSTYRATASHAFASTGTRLHSSIGTGFKAPTAYQLYGSFGVGNPNLQPEESTGVDFGVEQKLLNNTLTLEATAFHNDYKNLIDFTSAFQYANTAKANTKGLEMGAKYQLTPQWQLHSTYTYLLAENETNNRTLGRRPKHSLLGGVEYVKLGVFSVGADMRYISQQNDSNTNSNIVKQFVTFDVQGTYDITPTVSTYARIENLLNRDYQEIYRYNALGISATAGIKMTY
jgi:vitamin B12 transporter